MRLSTQLLVAALVLSIASCASPTNSSPSLDPAANLVATPGGKAISLSWSAVPNATSYKVYYTTDGTEPSVSSASAVPVGTKLSHTGLDDTKTYRYRVQAMASGYTASLSGSASAQPDFVFTYTVTAAGYANKSIIVQPYTAATSDTNFDNATVGTPVAATTDTNGVATISVTVDRTRLFGYTIAEDQNGNGSIDAGDTVWGNGTVGTLSYLFSASLRTTSRSYTFNPWDEWDSSNVGVDPTHTY